MYFWTYWLPKTSLEKCLKSSPSEVPLTKNMENGQKDCWNLNHSTFNIFIGPVSEVSLTINLVKKPKHSWNLNYSTFTIFIDLCEQN